MGNICCCSKLYLTQNEINKEKELDNKAFNELRKKISEKYNDSSCSSNSSTHDIYDSATESLCACCNNNMKSVIECNKSDSNNSIEIIHPLQYNSIFNENLNSIDENKSINNDNDIQIRKMIESHTTQSSNGSGSYIFANLDEFDLSKSTN